MAKIKITISPALTRFLIAFFIWASSIGVITFLDLYFITLLDRSAASFGEAKRMIATLEEKRAVLIRERTQLVRAEDKLAKIDKAFVDLSDPLPFVEKLEKFARAKGISLKLGLPQKREKSLAMGIEAEGQFADLISFIKSVETLSERAVFEDFLFERFPGKGKELRARAIARIEVLAQ